MCWLLSREVTSYGVSKAPGPSPAPRQGSQRRFQPPSSAFTKPLPLMRVPVTPPTGACPRGGWACPLVACARCPQPGGESLAPPRSMSRALPSRAPGASQSVCLGSVARGRRLALGTTCSLSQPPGLGARKWEPLSPPYPQGTGLGSSSHEHVVILTHDSDRLLPSPHLLAAPAEEGEA